ncbi:sensor histidine kinase [Streptomyces antarcticus]|uniref:sensor histidine kinase n=1 Tax=Streptomyces antarcticus TaxID=2996458 RepID=UPI002271C6D1|nr:MULTISPECIES: ATP-binding protein [unclassified Streptomyces]MCY0943770.1 ATP-binding protein [Streptomyces sp. H34-AA3]MCZ4086701.1 ATP-binding protein [Streptomyces sp. H34-S5]
MTAPPSPLRPSALALLITAAAGGALSTAAVAAAPSAVRVPLAWFSGSGVLLLAIAAFAVTWSARTARLLRGRVSGLTGEITSRDAYIARLTADTSREAATHHADRGRLAGAHAAELEGMTRAHAAQLDGLVAAHAIELDRLTAAQSASRERLGNELRRAESGRAAAMAAAANAAGRMQALATGMLADLRDMEHRHADEDVLGDLLHLDHRTAQAGRLADSIAVLTGARSGRRWAKPIVMESILRGAMGRIGGYQRVRLHSTSDAAVAGHAAEGVMHALAELLDNAANFSPPTAEVHVYVEEVPAGIIITVEDSGLVMSEVQLRRAQQAVTAESLDLAGLSGTRLGLAVVGRLARKHGLTVSFRPSARGGTGALMMLPQELISRTPSDAESGPEADARTAALPAGRTTPAALPAGAPAAEPDAVHETRAEPATAERGGARPRAAEAAAQVLPAAGAPAGAPGEAPHAGETGLPQRRRGRTLAAAHPEGPDAAGAAARTSGTASGTPTGASRSAARFGSFRQAVRGTSATPDAAAAPEQPPVPEQPADAAPSTAAERPTAPAQPTAPAPSSNPTHPEGNTE